MKLNEKKTHFEEILFLLSTLIAVFCYSKEYYILTVFFGLKALFDFYCAIKFAIKSNKDDELEKKLK